MVVSDSYAPDAGEGNGPAPSFTVSGPGGYLVPPDDLITTQAEQDPITNFGPYVFPSGGTYTIADATSSSSVSFMTTGSGSLSCASSATGPTDISSKLPTTSKAKSNSAKVIGTIEATVGAAGHPSLVLGGHALKRLKPGRYTIVVAVKAGLIIADGSKSHLNPNSLAFLGKGRHALTLAADTWYVESTTSSWETTFVVS